MRDYLSELENIEASIFNDISVLFVGPQMTKGTHPSFPFFRNTKWIDIQGTGFKIVGKNLVVLGGKYSGKKLSVLIAERVLDLFDLASLFEGLQTLRHRVNQLENAKSVLRTHGYILVMWCGDDIKQRFEDYKDNGRFNKDLEITTDDIETIIDNIERTHDANIGVTWGTIEIEIENHFENELKYD